MKYFKFALISEETGISWKIAQPLSGPSIPVSLLPGLTNVINLSYDGTYYLGEADDSALGNPDNYIFEITAEERAEELKKHIMHYRQERLERIYQEEKNLREGLFQKYGESAAIAGIYKYEQAKELVADNSAAAPIVRLEASIRSLDPVVMAQRIITNHEEFRNTEAKVAGIRGLVFDRLTNFVFDLQNPDASVTEFLSKEKIGEKTEEVFENGVLVNKIIDVNVGKYELALSLRIRHFN